MILRYGVLLALMGAALSACGNQQDAATPQPTSVQVQQQMPAPVTDMGTNASTNATTANPVGPSKSLASGFSNSDKAPSEETLHMADLLTNHGNFNTEQAAGEQSQNAPQ